MGGLLCCYIDGEATTFHLAFDCFVLISLCFSRETVKQMQARINGTLLRGASSQVRKSLSRLSSRWNRSLHGKYVLCRFLSFVLSSRLSDVISRTRPSLSGKSGPRIMLLTPKNDDC